jgi:histidine triad (HIT) family protein
VTKNHPIRKREQWCIFCGILDGTEPASIAYEDDQVAAFMDIGPFVEGHLLVVPREHYANFTDMPEELGARLIVVGMRLAKAIRASGLPCEGFGTRLVEGVAAGQEVFHVHLHMYPRYKGDPMDVSLSPLGFAERIRQLRGTPSREELDSLAKRIRAAYKQSFPTI